jgi:hypothetical protein
MSSDNMVLLKEWLPLKYSPDIVRESKQLNGGKVMLRGVIQRADTLNQNGRIYPRAILEREIDNYQKFIRENRALGECVDTETKILTTNGWKYLSEIEKNDKAYTLNLETNELQEQQILHVTDKPYEGKMLHLRNGGSLDMMLTPDHKMLLFDRQDKPIYITAQAVYDLYRENSSWLSHCSVKFTSSWSGKTPDEYTVPNTDITLNSNVWAAFLGIYLAEGCADGVKRGYSTSNTVQITQKKPENIELIRNLLSDMPVKWKEFVRSDGETVDFKCNHEGLHSYLYTLGSSSKKKIPSDILAWSRESLEILLSWLLLGDGRNRVIRGKIIRELYTTSKDLANDVCEIFLRLGVGSNARSYEQKDRVIEQDRIILAENSQPMWIVSENHASSIGMDLRFLKIDEIDYNDRVYCVTTPNGNWMAKRNGKMFWTGNCDHPDTSVVELKNVSHIVREAKMDGDTVTGVVELLDTPSGKILQSLVEAGITLGISSRGVGSTRNQSGAVVVQDDFQLICFDIVSEPSTPGAFMMNESKVISGRELKKTFTKSDRVNRIFTDILAWK